MKAAIKLYLLLLCVCLVLISCKKETPIEPMIDKSEKYYLHTIDGIELTSHKQRFKLLDYPLEFIFTRKDSIYCGNVIFEKIGKKVIDSLQTNKTSFSVDINYQGIEANFALFNSVNFNGDTLACRFWFSHPHIDYRTYTISAIRKY